MMTDSRHIIHRETIELSGSFYQQVQKLESDANRITTSIIHPEIERCFDSLIAGNDHVVIDKIEIDLGVFSPDGFEREIKARLQHQLISALNKFLSKRSFVRNPAAHPEGSLLSGSDHSEMARSPSLLLDALLYYLHHGYIPWWYEHDLNTIDSWKKMNQSSEALIILQTLFRSSSSVSRAVDALSDEMLGMICSEAGFGKSILQGWIEIGNNLKANQSEYLSCRNIFWEYCLCYVTGHRPRFEKSDVIQKIISISSLSHEDLDFFISSALQKLISPPGPIFKTGKSSLYHHDIPSHQNISSHQDKNKPNEDHPERMQGENPTSDVTPLAERQKSEKHSLQNDPPKISRKDENFLKDSSISREDDDILQITNAGMIIIHPFLSELFQSSGLTRDEQFISDDDAAYGVRLLDYLSSGIQSSPESELLLPKLMCGIAWSDSLSPMIHLDPDDMEACDELLRAVIRHWKVLGNSTEEGLRSGFFSRQGIMTQKDKGWLLKIENKAQDILLNKLPWGISTIKFPWMKDVLHISWI